MHTHTHTYTHHSNTHPCTHTHKHIKKGNRMRERETVIARERATLIFAP